MGWEADGVMVVTQVMMAAGNLPCNYFFTCSAAITKASYASWSSSCFSKEYARGWKRGFPDTIRLNPPPLAACNPEVVGSTPPPSIEPKTLVFTVLLG